MKSLHSFFMSNKNRIPQSFNTFKTWVLENEELRNCIKIVKLKNRNKYIVLDENGILEFYNKLS